MRVSPALWAVPLLLSGLVPLSAANAHKLVVISISGLDFRYLRDADTLHLKIPVLRKFMAQGAFADGVSGVPPTSSATAAHTLLTGVPPGGRVVKENTVTLWQAAAKARLKTASLFWPDTAGANIDFTCPEIRPVPFSGSVPFDPIADQCTRGLVERISSVYPGFRKSTWNDETSMSGLSYLLQYEQPDLTLVQLTGIDEEQRETGALSIYSRDLLENDDELLGQMLARLPAHSVVAIVSDHGFETQEHVVRPRVLANSQAVEVRFGLIGTSDPRVAATLRKLIGIRKTGIAREVPVAEVRRYRPELKTWVAAFGTMPGYIATEESKGPATGPGNHKGVDNLWPTRPNYRSVFLLWGEGIKRLHLGEISILQVAPTLASLLGVSLPDAVQPSLWSKLRSLPD